jgi:hypothetical protein
VRRKFLTGGEIEPDGVAWWNESSPSMRGINAS